MCTSTSTTGIRPAGQPRRPIHGERPPGPTAACGVAAGTHPRQPCAAPSVPITTHPGAQPGPPDFAASAASRLCLRGAVLRRVADRSIGLDHLNRREARFGRPVPDAAVLIRPPAPGRLVVAQGAGGEVAGGDLFPAAIRLAGQVILPAIVDADPVAALGMSLAELKRPIVSRQHLKRSLRALGATEPVAVDQVRWRAAFPFGRPDRWGVINEP
jgi:hypothetical protein